ncbi:MAG: MgtC/SapB family protein, partial [Lachnospiraceae bacterium]|nr:MgtC/SapB family protein [Lachnospiraceae bacterium]
MTLTIGTVMLRLFTAMTAGGILGWGRSRKNRAAGFRTYTLTATGAALAALLGIYEYSMLSSGWAQVVSEVGLKLDVSRYSASVIGGIGFLAAGTILSAAHQQVSGLSTAIGLFSTAVIGLAAGMGFYTAAFLSVILLLVVLDAFATVEPGFK